MDWIPYPLYVVKGTNGRVGVVPNEIELEEMREAIGKTESEMNKHRPKDESGEPVPEEKVDDQNFLYWNAYQTREVQRQLLAEAEVALEQVKEFVEPMRYEIRKPTFGEYVKIEANSRMFVQGKPMTDNAAFTVNILDGNVRLNGEVLTRKDVEQLDPPVAEKLYNRIYALCHPPVPVIPFWTAR